MTGLPDIIIIIDQQREYITLWECITLKISTITKKKRTLNDIHIM